jgi:hypothetical protein
MAVGKTGLPACPIFTKKAAFHFPNTLFEQGGDDRGANTKRISDI